MKKSINTNENSSASADPNIWRYRKNQETQIKLIAAITPQREPFIALPIKKISATQNELVIIGINFARKIGLAIKEPNI